MIIFDCKNSKKFLLINNTDKNFLLKELIILYKNTQIF